MGRRSCSKIADALGLATAAMTATTGPRKNSREPKESCKQSFCAGKVNLLIGIILHQQLARPKKISQPVSKRSKTGIQFFGGSPKCALCAAYAFASSSMLSRVAAIGSSLTMPEKIARSPISVSITNVGR